MMELSRGKRRGEKEGNTGANTKKNKKKKKRGVGCVRNEQTGLSYSSISDYYALDALHCFSVEVLMWLGLK